MTRAGAGDCTNGSIRTLPVKFASGPLPEGCEPLALISIVFSSLLSLNFYRRSEGLARSG
jgi:hypothetical protein